MGEEEIVLPTGVGLVTESNISKIANSCSAKCMVMLVEPEVGSLVGSNTGKERLPDKAKR